MIDVRELRFGNYYFYITGEIIKVDKKHFNYIDKFCKFANPIELTTEILEKWCGFEMTDAKTLVYKISWCSILYYSKESPYVSLCYNRKADYLDEITEIRIDYLHQLQNLIYALKGEELKVNYER